jgi:hypothetical protein
VNPQIYAEQHRTLLFHWEPPRQRKLTIAGFLGASVMLHALCFYVFQIVYPPTIALLPPPARVSVIAPTTEEARTFLNRLAAEDPALASQTQRPADARAFQLPKLAHVPSFIIVPPQLKEMPRREGEPSALLAMPPGPVPVASAPEAPTAVISPTTLTFSEALRPWPVSGPALKFRASMRETPASARFRLAVDSLGVVRYALLEQSSGDPALDEQARHYLTLTRFQPGPGTDTAGATIWAIATFDFGNDVELPSPAAERTP